MDHAGMNELAGTALMTRQRTRKPNTHATKMELLVADRCFDDLANFTRLRDPITFVSAESTDMSVLRQTMLQYTPDAIHKSLTTLDAALEAHAIESFNDVQRCMGDQPSAITADKESPIIEAASKEPLLCDEIYVQIMKQLTENASYESSGRGWELFERLAGEALPSDELCEFVVAFLTKAAIPGQLQDEGDGKEDMAKAMSKHASKRGSIKGNMYETEARLPSRRKTFIAFENEARPKRAADVLKIFQAARAAKSS